MKNTLLIAFIFLATGALAQSYKYDGVTFNLIGSNVEGTTFKDSIINVEFTPTDYFWGVNITNVTNGMVTIVWSESIFDLFGESSKMVFSTTSGISKNAPLASDIIAPGSSLSKDIFPVIRWQTRNPLPLYKRAWLNANPVPINIFLTVIANGISQIKTYKFTINI